MLTAAIQHAVAISRRGRGASTAAIAVIVLAVTLVGATGAGARQLVEANGSSVISFADVFGGVDVDCQPIGGASWSLQSVGQEGTLAAVGTSSTGTFYAPPSIARVGDDTVVAAEGANHSVDVWLQQPMFAIRGTASSGCDKNAWYPDPIPGVDNTYSAPSVAALGNNTIVITAMGPSGRLEFYSQILGSTSWSPVQVAGYQSVAGNPSIAVVNNTPVIVARGTGSTANHIELWYENTGTGEWSAPQPVDNAVPCTLLTNYSAGTIQYQDPSVAQIGGEVAVVTATAVGAGGNACGALEYYTAPLGSSSWTAQTVFGDLPQDTDPGGCFFAFAGPSLTQVGGSVEVAANGAWASNVCVFWMPIGGSAWSAPALVGQYSGTAVTYTSPASIAQVGNSSVVFYPYDDSGDFYWDAIGSPNWSTAQTIPGP